MRESDIPAMTVAPSLPSETVLFVTVTVNGDTDDTALTKVRRDARGEFSFDRAGLAPLRFDLSKLPTGSWVPASAMGPAQVAYDPGTQTMALTVPPGMLMASSLSGPHADRVHVSPSSWGALFNYQAYAVNDQTGKNGLYSLFGEVRGLSPYGVLDNTGLFTSVQGRQQFMRYDTYWTNAWPDKMLTARVGDLTTGGLAWTSPVRMAGFQISKSFTLRPDLITFPVPSFSGTAAATSAVDLYINNSKQYTGQVVSGPFTLSTVPTTTGAATADVVVHDALGRNVVQHLNFYIEPRMLAKGLDDYSFEVGFLRRYYGVEQAAYDRLPALSGVYRRGLSDRFTFETHLEGGGADHVAVAGAGGLWTLPAQMGVVNVSVLDDLTTGGAQLSFGYANLRQRAGVYGNVSGTVGRYHDLSSLPGYEASPLQWQVGASMPLGRKGSLSLNYLGALATPGLADSRRQTVGMTFSTQPLSNLNLFLSASRDLGSIKATTVMVGISLSFGNGVSIDSSVSHSTQDGLTNVNVSAQRQPPYDEGFGWQVIGHNNPYSGSATGRYRNAYIDGSLGIGQQDKTTQAQLNLSGSVLWMDHDVLPGRNVSNGFALVATGYPNVPVERENRPVGVTNRHGHVLVNDLNPYQDSLITIDPRQLPAGVDVGQLSQKVSPKANAGAIVRFDVKPVNGALLTLQQPDGKPVPMGSTVQMDTPGSLPQIVGYDGAVFVTGLSTHNTVHVTTGNGGCTLSFDYKDSPSKLPHLGPFTCTTHTEAAPTGGASPTPAPSSPAQAQPRSGAIEATTEPAAMGTAISTPSSTSNDSPMLTPDSLAPSIQDHGDTMY